MVSPNHDGVLQAVGMSLSNWSALELQLSTLFVATADMRNHNKASAVFASIISFEARLAICDRLMAHEGVDALESEMWNRMSARLSKFYKKRHELAHFSLNFDKKSGEAVVSPFLTDDKILRDQVRHLSLNQILERSSKFIDLYLALQWFSNRAFQRRGMYPQAPKVAPPEPPLVPRLRELAAQILEEQKRRAQ